MFSLKEKNTFLIVKDRIIEEILTDVLGKSIQKYTKTHYSIYIWSPWNPKDKMKYQVGDKLSPFQNKNLILYKRKDKMKKRTYSRPKKESFPDGIISEWFKRLNQEKINQVKTRSEKIFNNMDTYYRVYHHSFKMYWMRDYSFQLFHLLNYLVGQDFNPNFDEANFDDLMEKTNLYSFVLQKTMKKMEEIPFTMEQNEPDLWYQDSAHLLGSMLLLKKTLEAFIQFSQDFLDKKGLFYRESKTLHDYEALVIDCYKPIHDLRGLREKAELIESEVLACAK